MSLNQLISIRTAMISRFDAAFFTLQTLTRLEDKFFDNEEKLAEIRELEIRTSQRIEDIS